MSSWSAARENTPPRVLVVGNFLHGTLGTYGVCEELAGELARAGWQVITTSPQQRRVHRLIDMVQTAWRRRADYEVAQVDVYSGLAFSWAEAVCWALRRAGRPYVLTLHGGSLPSFARRWPRRVRRLLDSARAVTTPSQYLREQLADYCSPRLIPNAMRLQHYPFRPRTAPRPRLVWLRAFHEIYNPSLGPQVLALLKDDYPDLRLIMAGPDKGDGSLARVKTVATSLGVSDRLELPGAIRKSDVAAWLNQGDIFLNTTNVDNTPVSVIEALACGLCVVSTDVGGLPYLLRDGQTALLVGPQNPDAMAAAVRRVLAEPGLAARLSAQGRQHAEDMSWARVLPQWDRLLRDSMTRQTDDRRTPAISRVDA